MQCSLHYTLSQPPFCSLNIWALRCTASTLQWCCTKCHPGQVLWASLPLPACWMARLQQLCTAAPVEDLCLLHYTSSNACCAALRAGGSLHKNHQSWHRRGQVRHQCQAAGQGKSCCVAVGHRLLLLASRAAVERSASGLRPCHAGLCLWAALVLCKPAVLDAIMFQRAPVALCCTRHTPLSRCATLGCSADQRCRSSVAPVPVRWANGSPGCSNASAGLQHCPPPAVGLLQFVVGLGDKVAPTDIEEGMRVG